jgi:hypothetical protein
MVSDVRYWIVGVLMHLGNINMEGGVMRQDGILRKGAKLHEIDDRYTQG